MFGFVRQSKCDALTRELNQIITLCHEGGATSFAALDCVKELVDRVYVAASMVAEKEKLLHFNRGLKAGREVKHPAA